MKNFLYIFLLLIYPAHKVLLSKFLTSDFAFRISNFGFRISDLRFRIIVLYVAIFLPYLCAGQSAKPDSLKQALNTAKEDTTRIKLLNALGWELMYQNPDTSILLSNQALEILSSKFQVTSSKFKGENLGLDVWDLKLGALLVTSHNNLGVYYDLKGDYPRSLSHHFKALEIGEAILSEAK
ncbi:MAG: hypothetical protein FVQ77_14220, partial [Cytophagales bacterium]|nr:hypothetical protein [Cytophagales bacterium]